MNRTTAVVIIALCIAGSTGCSNVTVMSGKVTEMGSASAVGDGKTKDTAAFQKALDSGATLKLGQQQSEIVVPPGKYLIGSIVLPPHTTLRLEKGATLIGSPDINDYPVTKIRWEGRMRDGHRALISAADADHVAIVGPGKIVGAAPLGHLRNPRGPCIMEFLNCTNVRLEGFSVAYERMWAIHPTFCRDVVAKDLTIRSTLANGDGIDVDSCSNVFIDHCDIDTGDDAIALKSGRGMEGFQMARPTEDVRITRCTLGSHFAGLAIGSEMSGGVRNVTVKDTTFTRGSNSIFIKSRIGRGGAIENIAGSHLVARASCFLRIDLLGRGIQDEQPMPGDEGIPSAKNVRFSDVDTTCPTCVDAVLIPPQKPLDGLTLSHFTGTCRKPIELANIRNAKLDHVDVKSDATPPLVRIANVTGKGLEGAGPLEPRKPATDRAASTRATTAPATAGRSPSPSP